MKSDFGMDSDYLSSHFLLKHKCRPVLQFESSPERQVKTLLFPYFINTEECS